MINASLPHGRTLKFGRALFFLCATTAHARGILVSPTQLGLAGKPGQTVSGILYVSSSRAEENRVTIRISEFTRNEEGTVVELATPPARSCKTWLDVDRNELVSPQSGRIEVVVSARIPRDASGSYWALVGLQSEPPPRRTPGLSMQVIPRVAIPVIVTVEGSEKPRIKVVETRAVRSGDGIDVYSTIENAGTVAVLLSGAFSLERASSPGRANEELASVDVGPLTSLPGTRVKAKSHIVWSGALNGVEAHTYLRFGPGAADTAEGAVVIEEARKSATK